MKNKGGRPTVMTVETINKLEEVFAIGGSDREACFYANISMQTLYDYQKKVPKFIERKAALKEKPVLKARQEVVKGLNNNAEFSLKYLERKRKKEFSTRHEQAIEDDREDSSLEELKKINEQLSNRSRKENN